MKLIDAYIGEVTRRLPEKDREDIALELRSTIYDMLPEDPSESDVKAALSELGSPFTLANGYRNWPMHLIGPNYFAMYISLLKILLPIVLLVSFLSLLAADLIEHAGTMSLFTVLWMTIGNAFVVFFDVALQVLFWVTLGFVIYERSENRKKPESDWSPDDLKKTPGYLNGRGISKLEVFWDLFRVALFAMLYFTAANVAGGMEDSGTFVLIFNNEVLQAFMPLVVIVLICEVLFASYKLIVGVWTKRMAILNAAQLAFSTVVFLLILLNRNLITQETKSYFSIPGHYIERSLTFTAIVVVGIVVYEALKGFKRGRGQARA